MIPRRNFLEAFILRSTSLAPNVVREEWQQPLPEKHSDETKEPQEGRCRRRELH